VTWSRMDEIHGSALLLALPSLVEPWGLVCNEAMQCGTLCVVSPFVGAAGDLVRDGRNGLVLRLDPSLWAERIGGLLADPLRWEEMSSRAREDALTRDVGGSAAAFRAMVARALADA